MDNFPYNLPEYLLERQSLEREREQAMLLSPPNLLDTLPNVLYHTHLFVCQIILFISAQRKGTFLFNPLCCHQCFILFSQPELTGLWTGQTQATQPPLTSVTGDCGHCHLRKHSHSQGVAPCFQRRGLFVFYRPLWLWPWPTLKYLSTTNHQQPTPVTFGKWICLPLGRPQLYCPTKMSIRSPLDIALSA